MKSRIKGDVSKRHRKQGLIQVWTRKVYRKVHTCFIILITQILCQGVWVRYHRRANLEWTQGVRATRGQLGVASRVWGRPSSHIAVLQPHHSDNQTLKANWSIWPAMSRVCSKKWCSNRHRTQMTAAYWLSDRVGLRMLTFKKVRDLTTCDDKY